MLVSPKAYLVLSLLAMTFARPASAQTGGLTLGVYDPTQAFQQTSAVTREHVFVSWVGFDTTSFRSTLRYAQDEVRQLMVTVEPFRRQGDTSTPDQYLNSIAAGKYQAETRAICRAIGSAGAPVLVRWGHEMDDTSGRYPWANARAGLYIRAFRHFVNSCRRFAPQAKFIWSPMASQDPNRYYPGDGYVDYVGLPIWGLQKVDMDYFGRDRTFTELVGEKYRYIAARNKPVIIAEFGVSGADAYRASVLAGIQAAKAYLPLLTSVVYFNMKEPFPWWGGYGTPDWRVDPTLFVQLAGSAT